MKRSLVACLTFILLLSARVPAQTPAKPQPAKPQTAAIKQTTAPGVPYPADKIATLLPATVYFQGQTAPLQLRNAGGVSFANHQVVWVSLVDSSGYSTSIQEKYQFYLVTEGPLRFGDATLPAGAYGGGFLGDHFLLMDLGGHTVAQGPLQTNAALPRPRPLQLVPDTPSSVKLYLGRHWVAVQPAPSATP